MLKPRGINGGYLATMRVNRNSYFREYRKTRVGLSVEQRLREGILELLGNKCSSCGFSDTRALQIDHINGGGYATRLHTCTAKRYRKILEGGGDGYQLLCANCNQIKKYEKREVRK